MQRGKAAQLICFTDRWQKLARWPDQAVRHLEGAELSAEARKAIFAGRFSLATASGYPPGECFGVCRRKEGEWAAVGIPKWLASAGA